MTESESDGGDDDEDEAEEEAGADRVSSVTGSRYSWTTYFGVTINGGGYEPNVLRWDPLFTVLLVYV